MTSNNNEPGGETSDAPTPPSLDVSKLHALPSEQQDLYLLTHVCEIRRYVAGLSSQALPVQQVDLKKEIIKIVGLSTPAPSRIIRHSLGQILSTLYTHGSRQLLHENITDLLNIINAGKSDKDPITTHTAVVCLGYIFKSAGDSAVTIYGLAASSLLRSLKASQGHAGLRASTYCALASIVLGLTSSLDESTARDIWKQARGAAANDKSALVQKHACLCLESLFTKTPYFLNAGDFDNVKSTLWKTLESDVRITRQVGGGTLARVLLQIYDENKVSDARPASRKSKKSAKSQDVLSDEEEAASQQAETTAASSPSGFIIAQSLKETLKTLSSQYCKASTTHQMRLSLVNTYKVLLEGLPKKAVQNRFAEIAAHFFNELLDATTISSNRIRLLFSRRAVRFLLGDIIASRMLTENGQIQAARWLLNDILKNYPQVVASCEEPTKGTLVMAAQLLSCLLRFVGPAAVVFQDLCRETLFQVTSHPSYTVQIHLVACFREFVSSCPNQFPKCIAQALAHLKKEFEDNGGGSQKRAIAYALIIAAMLRSASTFPLYGSLELYSQLFSYATELLKSSATAELRMCSAQIQVAWTIIGGLVTLGPNFTKVHLNQLLLMWRNALPPPLAQENSSRRSHSELSFLAHVRECALTAMLAFLKFDGSLVTNDGFRRLSSMLQNSTNFMEALPPIRRTDDVSSRLFPGLQLHDHAVMLQRRLSQCMIKLLGLRHIDHAESGLHGDVVSAALRAFTEPVRPLQRGIELTLTSSASSFDRIWDLTDNWSYGLNSAVQEFEIQIPSTDLPRFIRLADGLRLPEGPLPDFDTSRACTRTLEHDAATVFYSLSEDLAYETALPETACVTDAIHLLAVALPLQPPRVQISCLEQMAIHLAQPTTREPGRKTALQINVATAMLSVLAVANGETQFHSGHLAVGAASKIMGEMIRTGITDSDPILRSIACQALSRLCNLAGTQFINSEVKHLIDTIVANREPHVRAGCVLALGLIHAQVGTMAASHHLERIVGVLLTLCHDAHPTVHFWALQSFVAVANSAGPSFSAYASGSLGMLAQIYSNDQFNEESLSTTTTNTELEYSTPTVLSQCVDSIINVLGPDLQDSSKTRALILNLLDYFEHDEIVFLQAQAYTCLSHVSLYAPAHVQLSGYVSRLQRALESPNVLLQRVAIEGLGTMIKRNAAEVGRVASASLLNSLWLKLDDGAEDHKIEHSLCQWLQQTCLTDTRQWLDQCQNILSKTRLKAEPKVGTSSIVKPKAALPDLADEEVAGFAAAAVADSDKVEAAVEGQEFLRWQTRDFAMSMLSELLDIVKAAMLPDRVIEAEAILQSRIGDVVRMAFSASTATVVNLRVRGLHILDQVLNIFGRTPDPDFLEASLLEQYQAQISSALTPAFAADSSPELAAEAITVCATFVGTGIVTNIDRMGRIFKVLSSGLENFASAQPEPSIGDLKGLSPNAQAMLKMSLLSGWAKLQMTANEQTYLDGIIQPYVSRLTPLWLRSLQEFAGLRFEPEISDSLGDYTTNNLQERYSALNREVRLAFYQRSWLNIVDAIAILVEKDSDAVFDALDNKSLDEQNGNVDGQASSGKDMSFREEPVAFFFILFGLTFEALVTQARDEPKQILEILSALKRILRPAVAGTAIYQDTVFDEFTGALDRLALTSTSEVQSVLVDIARNLSLDHVVARSENRHDKLSDDIEQLFELTRVIILILAGLIPGLDRSGAVATRALNEENISLVQMCFRALVAVADVFPVVIKADLHASIMHCYCTILATPVCQQEVMPRIMPSFRDFSASIAKSQQSGEQQPSASELMSSALTRMLDTLTMAQKREHDQSIVCARNSLVSITVLLTTTSSAVSIEGGLLNTLLSALLDALQDVGLGKTAANCIRSLLLVSPKSRTDEAISRILWPRALLLVVDPSMEDPESIKTPLMQALTTSVSILGTAAARLAATTILIPSLLLRANHTVPNGSTEDLSKESTARLLELAGIDGTAFRHVLTQLSSEQRRQLEGLLRSKSSRSNGISHERFDSSGSIEEKGPAIELRMDF